MVDAILISTENFNGVASITSYRYTISSVAAGGVSSEIRFTGLALQEHKIIGVRLINLSDNYDFSIRARASITPPDIDEILKIVAIDKVYQEMNLGILFHDSTEVSNTYLYAILSNNSSSLITGTTTIELTTGKM